MKEKLYWVWLSMVFGGGTRQLWSLMSIYETAEELSCELMSGSCRFALSDNIKKNVRTYSLKNAEELIASTEKKGMGIICYSDQEYPNQLRFIVDPPPILYYKGNIGCLTATKTITSVGTRKAGEYGISACNRICTELAEKGFIIVSGFAVGIDITSHMAAAANGYPTVCVLGCGIDIDYPKDNFKYRDIILEAGGVFISENPPGKPANRGSFPRRNRILSALGRAAIVFEAPVGSGSLLTADDAAEQGRELFVLPPADIFSGKFSGNIKLLREGAVPLMSVDDIIDLFSPGHPADKLIRADAFAYIVGRGSSVRRDVKKYSRIKEFHDREGIREAGSPAAEVPETKKTIPEADLNDIPEGLQRDIVKLLNAEGKLHADVIGEKLGADPSDLLIELTELEIIGAVKQHPGRIYEVDI